MLKVHLLNTCSHSNGEAYQPVGEAEDSYGYKYTHYAPCPICEAIGNEPMWVDKEDFTKLIHRQYSLTNI
jgi:hypothetical protein